MKVRPDVPARYLDVAGVAAYISTTETHIRELVRTERIPYTRIGPKQPGMERRPLRFDRYEIDAWMASNGVEAS